MFLFMHMLISMHILISLRSIRQRLNRSSRDCTVVIVAMSEELLSSWWFRDTTTSSRYSLTRLRITSQLCCNLVRIINVPHFTLVSKTQTYTTSASSNIMSSRLDTVLKQSISIRARFTLRCGTISTSIN